MQGRITQQHAGHAVEARRITAVPGLALAVLCALLGGCSSFTFETPLIFAGPGKFQYHSCDQLNSTAKSMVDRVHELKVLKEKADQGFAGPLVGTFAYQTDYLSANEDLRLIEETARAKNCATPSTWQSNNIIR